MCVLNVGEKEGDNYDKKVILMIFFENCAFALAPSNTLGGCQTASNEPATHTCKPSDENGAKELGKALHIKLGGYLAMSHSLEGHHLYSLHVSYYFGFLLACGVEQSE